MWPYPKIIAHRGGGMLAPENTLAALRCGLAHGFRAVEFDVMLSADNMPVLMHDPQFGRTVPGSGMVADMPAADLARLDAGAWFGPEFAGEPVPTYEQAVLFCKANGIWMNVEIKPTPGHEEKTGQVIAAWTQRLFAKELAIHGAGGRQAALPLFSSFSDIALLAAQAAAPGIPRGVLIDAPGADWLQQLWRFDAVALHANHRHLTPELARAVKKEGYGLLCYTVNTPERAREISAWGVDAFCTDRIDLIGPRFGC